MEEKAELYISILLIGNKYQEVNYWWDWGSWWWGMGLMMFLMIVFWGGVIALIVWAIARFTRREAQGEMRGEKRNSLDIAKERYARGEITKEQFEQLKKDLG